MSWLELFSSLIQLMLLLFIGLLVIPMIADKIKEARKSQNSKEPKNSDRGINRQTALSYLDEYKQNMRK